MRAAKGLIESGLTDPKSVKESDLWEKVEALNSQGSVQRGPSMSKRMEETAALVLEKYEGDLDKLREAAGKDPAKERELVKEFKGFGDTTVFIFCREVQVNWQELFPFADDRTLEMAGKHGIPNSSAEELAKLVDNDKAKFVQLLAAIVKAELRGEPKNEGKEDTSNAVGDESQDAEQPGNEDATDGKDDNKEVAEHPGNKNTADDKEAAEQPGNQDGNAETGGEENKEEEKPE